MPGGKKRHRKEEEAIAALLAEPTIDRAAAACGVSARTLKAWLADAAFLARYRQARRQVVEGAIAKLQRAAGEAVNTLRELLSADTPPPTRARAALGILDQATKGIQLIDFEERLAALESQPEGRKGG